MRKGFVRPVVQGKGTLKHVNSATKEIFNSTCSIHMYDLHSSWLV